MIAIGFIETHGYVAAIAASDAMLKAANVYLLERTMVGCGLVSISVASKDVSSVQAAVDAGVMQVLKMGGKLISKNVIARPATELEKCISLTPVSNNAPSLDESSALCHCGVSTVLASSVEPKAQTKTVEESSDKKKNTTVKKEILPKTIKKAADSKAEEQEVTQPIEKNKTKYSYTQLKKLTLGKLRQIALQCEPFSLTKEEIAKANRAALIRAISEI